MHTCSTSTSPPSSICGHDLLSIINSGVWKPILTPTHSSMIISDEPRCQDSNNPIYIYSLRLAIFYLPEIRSSVPSYQFNLVHSKYFTRSVIRYHFVINSLTTCLQAVLISITEWAEVYLSDLGGTNPISIHTTQQILSDHLRDTFMITLS